MSISKALQKLDDRINGLNIMRGRLVKFVNPSAPTQSPSTQTDTPAAQVDNTSTPTQAPTSNAPVLTDQERADRLNLINRLIATNNVSNEDLAPLGLHFENIEPFSGVAFRNNTPTDELKEYMKKLDAISALAVVYEALKNAPFRKMEARYILGDDGGIGSFFFSFVLGLARLYTDSINANDDLKNVLYFLITQATNYALVAALHSDNAGANLEAQRMIKQLQDDFNSFYADFPQDLFTLSYAFIGVQFRPLVIQLQEPLNIEQAIRLRRNMRPEYFNLVSRIVGALNPQYCLGFYVCYAVQGFCLKYLREYLPPLDHMPESVTTPMGATTITQEIKDAINGFYEFIKQEPIKINFAGIEVK
ncbi:hypothetical protein [Helicobacter suis]|uniref:hypothetical protein n=1 Tax=Helicobacter suis TaxID=104628 RepID=UPI0013CFCBAD|nr:hypothetical protein [Helicobacter suis]